MIQRDAAIMIRHIPSLGTAKATEVRQADSKSEISVLFILTSAVRLNVSSNKSC